MGRYAHEAKYRIHRVLYTAIDVVVAAVVVAAVAVAAVAVAAVIAAAAAATVTAATAAAVALQLPYGQHHDARLRLSIASKLLQPGHQLQRVQAARHDRMAAVLGKRPGPQQLVAEQLVAALGLREEARGGERRREGARREVRQEGEMRAKR